MEDRSYCLTEDELLSVESLLGHELDSELKDYLLECYGKRSWYQELRQWMADARERCDGRCEDC